MAQGRTDTVSAGITATDDEYILVFGADVIAIGQLRVQQALRIL